MHAHIHICIHGWNLYVQKAFLCSFMLHVTCGAGAPCKCEVKSMCTKELLHHEVSSIKMCMHLVVEYTVRRRCALMLLFESLVPGLPMFNRTQTVRS